MVKRTDRLNSLLKEVISDVVRLQVKHPHVSKFLTITRVDITRDLRHAKVYVSVIGEDKARNETLEALNQAAGFIAITASKQVTIRYFPALHFVLDDSVDHHMRIEELLGAIEAERSLREPEDEDDEEEETESAENE